MARMHPEEIEALEHATQGKRTVFRFLREIARPDQDFIWWYEPVIGGNRDKVIEKPSSSIESNERHI